MYQTGLAAIWHQGLMRVNGAYGRPFPLGLGSAQPLRYFQFVRSLSGVEAPDRFGTRCAS